MAPNASFFILKCSKITSVWGSIRFRPRWGSLNYSAPYQLFKSWIENGRTNRVYIWCIPHSWNPSWHRLVLRLPSHASVTDLMINRLHWLGFPQRIIYKLCVLTYKSLRGNAPAYMLRHFIPVASVAGRAQLRSASSGQLVVPFTRTVVMGGT